MVTAQQSSLPVRVAGPGTLFLSPGLGAGNALVVTLLVQLGVVVTGLLNLRLPRVVACDAGGGSAAS